MCRAMEDMRNESLKEGIAVGKKEGKIEAAKKMLHDGALPLEKVAEYAGLSLEEVKRLSAGQPA